MWNGLLESMSSHIAALHIRLLHISSVVDSCICSHTHTHLHESVQLSAFVHVFSILYIFPLQLCFIDSLQHCYYSAPNVIFFSILLFKIVCIVPSPLNARLKTNVAVVVFYSFYKFSHIWFSFGTSGCCQLIDSFKSIGILCALNFPSYSLLLIYKFLSWAWIVFKEFKDIKNDRFTNNNLNFLPKWKIKH